MGYFSEYEALKRERETVARRLSRQRWELPPAVADRVIAYTIAILGLALIAEKYWL